MRLPRQEGRLRRGVTPDDTGRAASYRDTAVAAGALSTGPFLQEALRHLGKLSGAERCSILLVEDGLLRSGASAGLSDEYVAATDGVTVAATVGSCGAAAATGRPYVTEDIDRDPNWTAFRAVARAAGVRSCWSVPVALPGGRVLGTFASYATAPATPGREELEAVEEYAPIVALGLESIRRQRELARSYESIVVALTSALDSRDEYTAVHSAETEALARRVGARLGLPPDALEALSRVATLHDIGKLGIPTQILGKPGPLTPQEQEVMRRHPVIGERILAGVPFLEDVAKAVRHEHERWDGAGYPDGLSGEGIPVASRIVFVCDSYHAMTSARPYRAAMEPGLARAEVREHAGTQFDPAVVAALLAELGDPSPATLTGQLVRAQAREHALAALADAVGADDLFVFRPTAGGDRWCHLDGAGRGGSWAGNLELLVAAEPRVRAALRVRVPLVVTAPEPVRIVGPYYARSAAVMVTPGGELVVLGAASPALAAVEPERLEAVAARAAGAVLEVPRAKRLADELEVLDAVRAVTTVPADGLAGALRAVAARAATALSCEFAAVATAPASGASSVVGWAGPGWSPERDALVHDALAQLVAGRASLPLLAQDTTAADAPLDLPGFRASDGITALQALPVGDGDDTVAVLLLAHASTTPRGFTTLCLRVAGAVADAAEAVVRRAVAQERLAAENGELARRVATDALTGVASRSWWEERLARDVEPGGPAGRPSSVVVVDVDGLKDINDARGHRAGDELLCACARLLLASCGPQDHVARIGGDEFAVLLHDAGPEAAAAWCERLAAAADEQGRRLPGPAMVVSIGWGTTASGGGLYAALARADVRMYEDKRARRTRRAPAPVS